MRLFLASAALIFVFFLSGCDDNKKENINPDNNSNDNISVVDEDGESVTDTDNEISDDAEVDDVDNEINNGLDESFLEPSKGFTFKIVSPLLPEAPSGYDLKPEEKPVVLKGELTDRSGNKFVFYNIDTASASVYEGYLYITANSEYSEKTYYTATILPSFSTLDWMVENDTDTVNATYFYLYIYKNDYVNENFLRICPDAIPDRSGESFLKAYIDEGKWNIDENIGIMLNSYLTFDKKAVVSFFGDELYKLCYCYESVAGDNFTQRDCTPEDMDLDPVAPSKPSPADGAENQEITIELSWDKGYDPDGGKVTYALLFGTVNPPSDIVLDSSSANSWKPEKSLNKNTQYFWQVIVTDDESNSTKSNIWTFNTDESIEEFPEHDFLIVVNGSLKGKLNDELSQYSQNLKDQGFEPFIRYWTPGGAEILKAIIKKSYDEKNIKGVVLIGDMPSASYEQMADFGEPYGIVYEEFPCEFFFMDMDGSWEDKDKNGIFDKYPDPLTLEIFSSRIIGSVDEISAYLGRAAEYRKNGSFFDSRNFFSFIDDDWNSYEDEHGNIHDDYMGTKNGEWELGGIYGENYERREDRENTTKATYMDFMTNKGAEFVYQWIHSDPQRIYIDDNFSPNPSNIISIQEIIEGKVKGSFYNLFDCSISRYTEKEGNIASEYIKGEYGLATIGSTKTGGIFNPEVMNIALANGENWGTAYQMWVNDIWENYASYGFDKPFIDSWWLGMMIQGDPTLRLTDKKGFITKSVYPKKRYSKEFIKWINSTRY